MSLQHSVWEMNNVEGEYCQVIVVEIDKTNRSNSKRTFDTVHVAEPNDVFSFLLFLDFELGDSLLI